MLRDGSPFVAYCDWLRSLPADVGQFVAGILAGYKPGEIAQQHGWSVTQLGVIRRLTYKALKQRQAEMKG